MYSLSIVELEPPAPAALVESGFSLPSPSAAARRLYAGVGQSISIYPIETIPLRPGAHRAIRTSELPVRPPLIPLAFLRSRASWRLLHCCSQKWATRDALRRLACLTFLAVRESRMGWETSWRNHVPLCFLPFGVAGQRRTRTR